MMMTFVKPLTVFQILAFALFPLILLTLPLAADANHLCGTVNQECVAGSADCDAHCAATVTSLPTGQITGIGTVTGWLTRAANWIFTLIMALAAIILLIGAFNILTAGGDATKVGAGKNWIIWGIVGVIVAILSRGLLTLACEFVGYVC